MTGIDVTWAYDEMYSMLLLDELSLDPDFDGILTDAELEELDGYDLNWMEGFAGDLYVTAPDGQDLALGPPEGWASPSTTASMPAVTAAAPRPCRRRTGWW